MPLRDDHQIVSVDDHLIEHPRVWQDRVPAKHRELAPKIVESGGHHIWLFEGQRFPTVGLNAVAGKPRDQWGVDPVRYEDMIPGAYNPAERIKDMDLDGVQAALCFPTFPGFAASVFHKAKDKDLAYECIKAWNDFNIDEWCATAPHRLIPFAILPTWDMTQCLKEAERVFSKGARSVGFPDAAVPLGLPSVHTDYWDPLWSICEEAGIPISMHFGSGTFVPGFEFSVNDGNTSQKTEGVPWMVAITLFSTNLMWTTVDLLFSGSRALQRHPQLQFSLAEGGIGWIPYILERADYTWERHRWYQNVDMNTKPSELFRQHFWGCFIDDEHGLNNRDIIGIDRIMLEVDYPHSDSNWPNSRKRAAEVLSAVPDNEVEMIVETNARRMLKFPR
jgi:predicted TIM-barrel fold metal-dependent hydrolase